MSKNLHLQIAASVIASLVCIAGFLGIGVIDTHSPVTIPLSLGVSLALSIFIMAAVLHRTNLLSLKLLLISASILALILASLLGYPSLVGCLIFFLALLLTFNLAGLCWWHIAKPETTFSTNTDEKYHTLLRRITAWWIDCVALYPFFYCTELLLALQPTTLVYTVWLSISATLATLYFVLLHKTFGKTLGKWICNVKVVDSSAESSVSLKQAILRDIVPIIITPFYIYSYSVYYKTHYNDWLTNGSVETNVTGTYLSWSLWGWLAIKLLTALIHKNGRGVHDLIAQTTVIRDAK